MLWEGITYLDRSLGRDALLFRFDVPQTWQQGYIMPLTRLSTRTIDRQGGTVLQSTRTNGEPEVYDKHMAIYYANLIMSQVEVSRHGVMAAYRDGAFIATDIPGKTHPARRINPADYHATRYRPRFERITGPYRPQPAAEKP
jgi:hypothetical protein